MGSTGGEGIALKVGLMWESWAVDLEELSVLCAFFRSKLDCLISLGFFELFGFAELSLNGSSSSIDSSCALSFCLDFDLDDSDVFSLLWCRELFCDDDSKDIEEDNDEEGVEDVPEVELEDDDDDDVVSEPSSLFFFFFFEENLERNVSFSVCGLDEDEDEDEDEEDEGIGTPSLCMSGLKLWDVELGTEIDEAERIDVNFGTWDEADEEDEDDDDEDEDEDDDEDEELGASKEFCFSANSKSLSFSWMYRFASVASACWKGNRKKDQKVNQTENRKEIKMNELQNERMNEMYLTVSFLKQKKSSSPFEHLLRSAGKWPVMVLVTTW